MKKNPMKVASYKEAIEWIALNDGAGDQECLKADHVSSMVTSCLVADLFGVPQEKVGAAVVRLRRKLKKEGRF